MTLLRFIVPQGALFSLHLRFGGASYPREVPVLSVATSRVDWRSIVFLTGGYVRNRYGVESDGLVVPVDAVFPGSRVVRLDDMLGWEEDPMEEGVTYFPICSQWRTDAGRDSSPR